MINPGTVLQNRYRVQKQIGQGGMGAVYVATDERFGSTVAIKETFFSDAGFGKAFEREARLLNNLRHPALPRVSDHFADDNGQFLVMEYIAGEDLSEMMEKKNGAFPLTDVLNWADQLLDALDFLHTQEMPVIHRDIKPQNLKLTPRGQIILLDFGLAKGNPTDAGHQTAAKSVFGFSRNYASIEQIQGTGTDPRSDLYSLGATLYHLITGTPPVDALTRAMQVLNGDQDPLVPANVAHSQVPVGIAEVLQRAMDLNSNNRPTSAVAMRTMLAESDKIVAESISKPQTAGILTQKTEVFADARANQTLQAGVRTEVLPVENSAAFLSEGETELTVPKQNIQIPVQPKIATENLPIAENTQTGGAKRGTAIGAAAFGGLLLVGSALGGFYWLNSNSSRNSAANTNVAAENKTIPNEPTQNQIYAGASEANSTNSNSAVNLSAAPAPATAKKETTEKPTDKPVETAAPKSADEPKETAKATATPTEKKEPKAIITDEEGNKVLEDGTVKAKDGTTVYPDGRIVKNGKVIVNPNSTSPQVRPTPPSNGMPPLTREQMEKLTPEQRRRLRQIMERQKRQGTPPPKPPYP
jgi:serine/threonine protein kinase